MPDLVSKKIKNGLRLCSDSESDVSTVAGPCVRESFDANPGNQVENYQSRINLSSSLVESVVGPSPFNECLAKELVERWLYDHIETWQSMGADKICHSAYDFLVE